MEKITKVAYKAFNGKIVRKRSNQGVSDLKVKGRLSKVKGITGKNAFLKLNSLQTLKVY